jgi:hypothetical protein
MDMVHRKVGWLHVIPFQTLLNFSTDIHLKILQDCGFKTVADKFLARMQSFSGDSPEKKFVIHVHYYFKICSYKTRDAHGAFLFICHNICSFLESILFI